MVGVLMTMRWLFMVQVGFIRVSIMVYGFLLWSELCLLSIGLVHLVVGLT